MRLLVTRPEPDADALVRRLRALGHEALVEPLLAVEFQSLPRQAVEGCSAVVATSRNAVRAVMDDPAVLARLRRRQLFAVGEETARLARAAGFEQVVTGPGTASGMTPVIAAHHPSGTLLYLSGEDVAFDLAAALTSAGLEVRRAVVYRTVAARSLRTETREALTAGAIDAVLLMSPRTAEVYRDLVIAAGLSEAARRVRCLCLSPAVAAALPPLAADVVQCAGKPKIEDLLALIAA